MFSTVKIEPVKREITGRVQNTGDIPVEAGLKRDGNRKSTAPMAAGCVVNGDIDGFGYNDVAHVYRLGDEELTAAAAASGKISDVLCQAYVDYGA